MLEAYRLVIFDLGETLVSYEGLALDWQAHYRPALMQAWLASTQALGLPSEKLAPAMLDQACSVLNSYNTRTHPRLQEVAEGEVLAAVAALYDLPAAPFEQAFFRYFQRRAQAAPGALRVLQTLSEKAIPVAILSDVPYGMPKLFIEEDLGELLPYCQVVVSSCEVGWRKPDPRGLQNLLTRFDVLPAQACYVGNERKDMQAAAAAGVSGILLSTEKQIDWGQAQRVASLADLCAENS